MTIMMERRKIGSSKTVVSLNHLCKLSSVLRPDNTAHVRALEALLRNPIKFTPATERTKSDRHKMANSVGDRIMKWKSDRDRREKRRRLVVGANLQHSTFEAYLRHQMRHLNKAWEPYIVLQAIRSFGLFNTGQTCYRNASIQVLMHLPIFLNWLEDYHHPDDCKLRRLLLQNLEGRKLIHYIRQDTGTVHGVPPETHEDCVLGALFRCRTAYCSCQEGN